MRNILIIFIIGFFSLVKVNGQITFDPSYDPGGNKDARPAVIVSGSQTGDDLRAYIEDNPSIGSFSNNDITFNAELVINDNAEYTDSNAVYHFPDVFRFTPRSNSVVNFTDFTIHYSGEDKGHTFNEPYTANFNRVFYLLGSETGRSDFFNNGDYTFNMNDVTFISYGDNDFIHFQSNSTLNNITITNVEGGMNFEPGANNAGDTEVINNLKLIGINKIFGGKVAQGDFKAFNMEWLVDDWDFVTRQVDFFFVNPIKPDTWIGYSGGSTLSVQEFYTHDVFVTDENLNPINGITVTLFNNNESSFDYTEVTDVNGRIEQQEVLKIDNTISTNYDRGSSYMIIADYSTKYYSVFRDFTQPIVDNVTIVADEFISENNTSVVANYGGIDINHGAKTITITQDRTLCEVYDYIKLNKLSNLTQPTIFDVCAEAKEDVLDITDYQLVLSGAAVLSPCDKFVKIESATSSNIADLGNLQVGIEDPTQSFKFIRISNLNNANVEVVDRSMEPNTVFLSLTNFTGVSTSVTQFDSENVRINVTRDGYTDWSLEQDFSIDQDIFEFVAQQAPIEDPASSEKQDEIIFLAKKILMKNEGVLQQLSGVTPTVSINNISQEASIQATEERQEEIINLLKRILTKTTVIKKTVE